MSLRTYSPDELKAILDDHAKWLRGDGGERANLWGANLGYADLRGANLWGAGLGYADLRYANLRYADLRYANLGYADLGGANFGGANLGYADLGGAKWNDATHWPAITAVLLANWGEVSDDLCRDLMRYDAAAHPDPAAFDRWAHGDGTCPFDGVKVQRAALFAEKRALWSPGSVRPYDLFQRLLAEKLVKVSE